jgi:hypothetical protein
MANFGSTGFGLMTGRTTSGVAAAVLALSISSGTLRAETPPPEPAPAPAPPAATYDKGFAIKTDNFEFHIGTRTQLQFASTSPDTFMYDTLLKKQQDTDRDNELTIRRLKVYMSGFAYKPTIKWKVQLDVERFKPGGGASGNVRLEEAFVDMTQKPWTQLRVGQFKVPYGFEKMTSSGKLNLVDRSIVHSFFGVNQEPGVDLYGVSFDKKFRYDVAVSTGVSDNNGFDTRNELDANGKSDFRYMGRVTYEPLDPYTLNPTFSWEQGAVSAPAKPQLSLQLGFMSNQTAVPQDGDPFLPAGRILPFGRGVLGANSMTFDSSLDSFLNTWSSVSNNRKAYDRNEAELVALFKVHRFSIESQAILGKVNPDMRYLEGKDDRLRDLNFDNKGYRLQSGVMLIPTRLELVGRWARVTRDAKAKFDTSGNGKGSSTPSSVRESIDQDELRAGVNWYFSRHDWKWQFDVGRISTQWKLNGEKLAVPDRSEFAGGVGFDNKVIQNNTRKDTEFRSQFQFQF